MLFRVKQAGQRAFRICRAVAQAPRTFRALRREHGAISAEAAYRVAVFPSLGLAYNRIKKNANTSTVILLRQLEAGHVEERNVAKWNARTYFDLTSAQLQKLGDLHLLVITRNPYSRVLSAFRDKFRNDRYQRRHGPFDLTPEGFQHFLNWLDKGGLVRDAHWDLQVKLMMLSLSGYDTVIRFETYREDMAALLQKRGVALPSGALQDLYPSDTAKKTGSDDKIGMFYTPQSVALVRKLYARDFSELGYSMELPVRSA